MNELILNFESRTGLGPVLAAKLLGYPYSTYAQFKNNKRAIKPYLRNHIYAVLLLPDDSLSRLIQEVVARGSTER